MKTEIKPQETNRAQAFELWMSSRNPMAMWDKYRKGLFRTTLPISYQFHHVQMDGGRAAKSLQLLQDPGLRQAKLSYHPEILLTYNAVHIAKND